jgi:predicted extracellular nuclease
MQKILFYCALFTVFSGQAQKARIGFYNVENLFDTINDPNKNDEDFLPEGSYKWTGVRYMEKINHINAVFGLMGDLLAVGVCEIENEAVIRDIIRFSPTMSKKHGVVHAESMDARGIDVGIIYDSTKLKLITQGIIRFTLPGKEIPTSRDILWAKFLSKKDTIHMLINHWPSRSGGEEASEPNRMEAAKNGKRYLDSVLTIHPDAKIIFMGDLNDYPTNNAPKLIAEKLHPQICKASGIYGGSYFYKGEWDILDHILVSDKLVSKSKGFKVIPNSGKIHSPELLMELYKGDIIPFRTYGGKKYLGGYSDHLPVTIDVKLK